MRDGGGAFRAIDTTPDSPCPVAGIENVLALGQVHSEFQPIFDLDSGAVVAYEALARGPVGPLRRPDMLFAAARAANRLCDLDVLCRRSAIRDAIDAGIDAPLTLFVNIEPEIVDVTQLEELLTITDCTASRMHLVLEITERAIATRPAELLATVRRLRRAGWRIALDDVGADDISIAFMPLLRPDIVKLDLQLVQRRPNPKIAEIMNAVNAYAERTGSVILAEGIEDDTHLATARALGARLAQGYLFGAPLPGRTPGVVVGGLALRPMTGTTDQDLAPFDLSPFDSLPTTVHTRRSTKPLLIEISKHLERQALRLGRSCILLSTFQRADNFGAPTARRYETLAGQAGFVAAIGAGLSSHPAPGVRGADLDPCDPVRGEWDIVVLAPHFAAALIAREIGPATAPDEKRTFEFVLSYDRAIVEAAAQSLMTRIEPSANPASGVIPADLMDALTTG